jgi:hypothetical protein
LGECSINSKIRGLPCTAVLLSGRVRVREQCH